MICYRCQTENEAGDPSTGSGRPHYCKQCGADLWVSPEQKDDGSRNSLMYVLILMAWEYFTYIVWMIVPKLISVTSYRSGLSGFGSGVRRMTSIFSVIRWTTGGLTLLLTILFAILSTNTRARVCLIVFAVIRLIMLLVYR